MVEIAGFDRIVDRTMKMDLTWDWPCGVAYYGISEAVPCPFYITPKKNVICAKEKGRSIIFR